MNEDIKAWLGLNLQDTLINLSGLTMIAGFVFRSSPLTEVLFGLTFILSLLGLYIYFTRENSKVSTSTALWNRWLSLLIVIVIWILVIYLLSSWGYPIYEKV